MFQPHCPLWSSLTIPNSFLSQALTVFSPHLEDSSLSLQGLVHPKILSVLKCHLLKEAFSDGCVFLSLCSPRPAPAHCVSLHSVSFFHFTKFLMIRLHCTIIFSTFQFKVIGIFYLPQESTHSKKAEIVVHIHQSSPENLSLVLETQ